MTEPLAPCPGCGQSGLETTDPDWIGCGACTFEASREDWQRRAAPEPPECTPAGKMAVELKRYIQSMLREGRGWEIDEADLRPFLFRLAPEPPQRYEVHPINAVPPYALPRPPQPKALPDAPGWWWLWHDDGREWSCYGIERYQGELVHEFGTLESKVGVGRWIGPIEPPPAPTEPKFNQQVADIKLRRVPPGGCECGGIAHHRPGCLVGLTEPDA